MFPVFRRLPASCLFLPLPRGLLSAAGSCDVHHGQVGAGLSPRSPLRRLRKHSIRVPRVDLLFIFLGHPPRILRRHVCVCFRVCVRLGRPIPSSGPSSRAQTRHTCASALCKIALRLPDPVRFDAYCFLKGLADSAALFPLVEQQQQPRQEGHGDATAAPEAEAGAGGGGGDGLLDGYRREQELLSERIENGASARAWGFNGPGFARRLVLSACPLTGGAVASMPVFVVWGGGYEEPPRFSLLAFLVRLECAAQPWPLTGVHARHT